MVGVESSARLTQSSHKLVLYPQGYADGAARAKCDMLVHHCGGDAQRTFDLKRASLDVALAYARRVRAFQNRLRPALCVVHETRDLAATLDVRVTFEDSIPIAGTALWALFWDPASDPGFLERAQLRGSLIGELNEGACYRHQTGSEFLLLCPAIDNYAALAHEAELIAFSRRPKRDKGLRNSPLNVQLLTS